MMNPTVVATRVILVFVLGVAAFVSGCADEDAGAPGLVTSSAPEAGRTPSAPSPTPTPEVHQQASTVQPPMPFPDDLALIVLQSAPAGPGSDQFTEQSARDWLARIYRDSSGEVRIETLAVDPGGSTLYSEFFTVAVAPGAEAVVRVACVGGPCTAGMSVQRPESRTTISRSDDGGITWKELAVLPTGVAPEVWGFWGDQLVVYQTFDYRSGEVWLHPSGQAFLLEDGPGYLERYVPSADRTLDSILEWRIDRREQTYSDRQTGAIRGELHGQRSATAYLWNTPSGSVPEVGGWAWSRSEKAPEYRYELDGRFTLRRWVPDWGPFELIGTKEVNGRCDFARFFVQSGEVVPLVTPLAQPCAFELVGVQIGPFARALPEGECVEIHRDVDMTSATVACASEGVLLRHNESPTLDGDWLGVWTPVGEFGWARTSELDW